jgi:hypothetical protein
MTVEEIMKALEPIKKAYDIEIINQNLWLWKPYHICVPLVKIIDVTEDMDEINICLKDQSVRLWKTYGDPRIKL